MPDNPGNASKNTRKRITNIGDREELVKTRLGSFYKEALKENVSLKRYFDISRLRFLGAGVFGHVFSIRALKDLNFNDLETFTKSMTKDENHKTHNKVLTLKVPNPADVVLRRGTEVAIKCETAFVFQPEEFPIRQDNLPKLDTDRFSVYKEYNALCQIHNRYGYHNVRGFTKPYAFGRLTDLYELDTSDNQRTKLYGFHVLVFEMCGPDMEDLMNACSYDCKQMDQRFSPRTVMMIGDQLLARLQSIQEPQLGFTHNDLKNDQLMIGRFNNANTIYLIDYGLVSKYSETWGKETTQQLGNRRWAPRSNHLSKPRTPLCEMESAAYVLLRLLRNFFPWDGLYDKQQVRMVEMKERGEDVSDMKNGDQVVYEVKQAMWLHMKYGDASNKVPTVKDTNGCEIDFKGYFEELDDKWGDGGTQVLELMMEIAKMAGHKELFFWENPISYENINYIDLRKHLLSMFDLSMYSHSLETAGLADGQKMKLTKFFADNKAANNLRTECGRPVYYYFPEGEQICYWEWYCRAVDMFEDKPAYWHKLLANREELLNRLKSKKQGKEKGKDRRGREKARKR